VLQSVPTPHPARVSGTAFGDILARSLGPRTRLTVSPRGRYAEGRRPLRGGFPTGRFRPHPRPKARPRRCPKPGVRSASCFRLKWAGSGRIDIGRTYGEPDLHLNVGRSFDTRKAKVKTLLNPHDLSTHAHFAVLDDGVCFSLVPWKPVLEQRLGQTVTAVTRGGAVSWDLSRQRVIGL